MTKTVRVKGIVQGVGFRPFVKKLADSIGLKGTVLNDGEGVLITVNAEGAQLEDFIEKLENSAPPLSHIAGIEVSDSTDIVFNSFQISASEKSGGGTSVSPDSAVCKECVKEISDKSERRYLYPFTNCTDCGPRYSIMKDLPYDRPNTVMASFKMCDCCKKEYEDTKNRRFHAEPIACHECGPAVTLNFHGNMIYDNEEVFKKAGEYIDGGGIIALKGLGGYHLICDAANDDAVLNLRRLKKRNSKPFAIMAENVDIIKKYAPLPEAAESLLTGAESPVVIFNWREKPFSSHVAPCSDKIGVMTAYTPIHIILFRFVKTKFLVATSGNMKDEPIAKTCEEAEENLKIFTDVFLHHNRDIYTRVDDSVLTLTDFGYTVLRRARGFAPFPVKLECDKNEHVFAGGANLKSSVAFYKNGFAFLSQYLGDLDNIKTEETYKETYDNMRRLFNVNPDIAVCDLHVQYRSSIFIRERFSKVYAVQHHAAHFASCLAENVWHGDAIGVVMDGFGLGTDGKGWGGEIFVKIGKVMERRAHIENRIQPGLDSAARNPIRMAVSYLYSCGLLDKTRSFLTENGLSSHNEIELIKAAVDNNINSMETSAAGRLFEAAGSLILGKRSNEYEGELAVLLENTARRDVDKGYEFTFDGGIINILPAFKALADDLLKGEDKSLMASKFHKGFADIICEAVLFVSREYGVDTVCLTGGVMQNILLLNTIYGNLRNHGKNVLIHRKVPANDGGIALGQLYFYLKDMELKS